MLKLTFLVTSFPVYTLHIHTYIILYAYIYINSIVFCFLILFSNPLSLLFSSSSFSLASNFI